MEEGNLNIIPCMDLSLSNSFNSNNKTLTNNFINNKIN